MKENKAVIGEAVLNVEVTPSTPDKVLSFEMTREADENGHVAIASNEHAQESDDRSDSESNGEVTRGVGPFRRGIPRSATVRDLIH